MTKFYYKIKEGGDWYTVEVSNRESPTISCVHASHVLIEQLADGTGIYRKNRRHPFKEDWFRVDPEGMTMIALAARPYRHL